MTFWTLESLNLEPFRPGIASRAEMGTDLIMVCMEIGPAMEDPGHEHPFDQCGVVLKGTIEMFIGDERRLLGPEETYFAPAGVRHGWKTFDAPVRVLDISRKS